MDRVRTLFEHHPDPASDAGDEAFALIRAAAECTHACIACADACLSEDDPAPLRRCVRIDLDCADITAATGRLLARPGEQDRELLRAQLEACATACRTCADECDQHAERMEHCRICAESCRACAEACDTMMEALVA